MISRRRLLIGAAGGLPGVDTICGLMPRAAAQPVPHLAALVVGIDRYASARSLRGAVNDAEDISDALKANGVVATTLRNGDATRDAIEWHLQNLLDAAPSGDIVLFSFAGHGAHETAPGVGRPMRETLLLGGFSPQKPSNRERWRGEELLSLFAQAGTRGVNVIFLADACFAGGLVRPFDTRSLMLPTRTAGVVEIEDDALPPVPLGPVTIPAGTRPKLPRLVFLSAALKEEQAPEVPIDGRPRGALSWAFARLLRGDAGGGAGELRLGQLRRFVIENVRMQSGASQTPDILPDDDDDRLLMRTAGGGTAQNPAGPLRLFVRAGGEVSLPATLPDRVRVVPSQEEGVELVWDVMRAELVDRGDLVADEVTATALPTTLEKIVAERDLQNLVPAHPMVMRLKPSDGIHHQGEEISFEIEGRDGAALILFSLASDGRVQYHWPKHDNEKEPRLDKPVSLVFRVGPPFGRDYLVALASVEDQSEAAARLYIMDNKPLSGSAALLVQSLVRERHVQLGLQPLFTTR
jgi:hypothetical protein